MTACTYYLLTFFFLFLVRSELNACQSAMSSGAVLERSVGKQFTFQNPLFLCSTVLPALYQILAPQEADEFKVALSGLPQTSVLVYH